MMPSKTRARRGILVPIDLHGINRGALETLVRIARHLDRDLLAVLLEDTRLQRAADLPFATEISLSGGPDRRLQRHRLSRQYSRTCADARRLLRELALSHHIELRFEDAAGARWRLALERDGNLDLFFPARQRWHTGLPSSRMGSALARRLGVVLAQGEVHASVLATTVTMVQAGLVQELYVIGRDPLPAEILQALHHPGLRLRQLTGFTCDTDNIERLIRQSPYDLLLLPRQCLRNIAPDNLEAALDRSGSQILVID